VLTTNLILADHAVDFASFMLATAAAFVVGKSVLVANAIVLLGRFLGDPRGALYRRRARLRLWP
jgi:hypothetical protein